MWELSQPWWEIIFRALLLYAVVFILFRVLGKKQLGEFSPFDFVLLLIVSESISQGLSGQEQSVTGAVISAATLLGISRLLDYASFKSRRFEKFMDGVPLIIVRNGKIDEKIRNEAGITFEELMSALRQHEVSDVQELKYAILETNGKITVVKKESEK